MSPNLQIIRVRVVLRYTEVEPQYCQLYSFRILLELIHANEKYWKRSSFSFCHPLPTLLTPTFLPPTYQHLNYIDSFGLDGRDISMAGISTRILEGQCEAINSYISKTLDSTG